MDSARRPPECRLPPSPSTTAGPPPRRSSLFLRDGDRFLELEAHDTARGDDGGIAARREHGGCSGTRSHPRADRRALPAAGDGAHDRAGARADRHLCRVFLLAELASTSNADVAMATVSPSDRASVFMVTDMDATPFTRPPDRTMQSGLTRRRPWVQSPSRHRRWARPAWRKWLARLVGLGGQARNGLHLDDVPAASVTTRGFGGSGGERLCCRRRGTGPRSGCRGAGLTCRAGAGGRAAVNRGGLGATRLDCSRLRRARLGGGRTIGALGCRRRRVLSRSVLGRPRTARGRDCDGCRNDDHQALEMSHWAFTFCFRPPAAVSPS